MWNRSKVKLGHQSGWCHEPGSYKACPNEAVTSFLCLHKHSVWNCPCLIWFCLSVFITSNMASKQQQGFRMCVHPCPCYLTGGDTHILCVACLGEEHARSELPLLTLWSRCCRGTAKAAVLEFAKGSVSRGRDGHCLFSAVTWQIQCLSGWTRWCRRCQGFICMLFPRSLCSRESWREFAGPGFYYFSLPRGGRAEYGSQI